MKIYYLICFMNSLSIPQYVEVKTGNETIGYFDLASNLLWDRNGYTKHLSWSS